MDLFLEDAERIFESAMAAAALDSGRSDMAILLDSNRAIRIVDASGWQLESLRSDYGATTVYRIARDAAGVCLEGRSGQRSCRLKEENPNATARSLLNARWSAATLNSMPGLNPAGRASVWQSTAVAARSGFDGNGSSESQKEISSFLHDYARPGT